MTFHGVGMGMELHIFSSLEDNLSLQLGLCKYSILIRYKVIVSWESISSKLYFTFSNSLIIHQEKTKKITTVTVVWICDPNYHNILPTLALNFSKDY